VLSAQGLVDGPFVANLFLSEQISIAGPTHVWRVKGGVVTEEAISPADFGLPAHDLALVSGGEPEENRVRAFLLIGIEYPSGLGPITD
jgi:anthranilate phosphoribosyltransferase